MLKGQMSLLSSDGTTSQAQLLEEATVKGARYLYVKANAAIAAFQACYVLSDGTISLATPALLTTTRPTRVVIPQYAFASGEFGWAWCGPGYLREDDVTTFKVLSKIATANVAMYAVAATPGTVDDAVAAPIIAGLFLTSACAVDDTATACQGTRVFATTS